MFNERTNLIQKIVKEAGVIITQIDGKDIDFTQVEKQCVVGTNGLVHDEILKLLK